VLSAGTTVRLLTAPLAGRTGDVLQGLRAGRAGRPVDVDAEAARVQ
jgi:hypothetical protein